jgi:peptidyl-prolyl cis-trans isomerase B (cyclophilin B)
VVTSDQRRRQLAREKYLRQQERRQTARRKANRRNSVIAAVLAVAVIGTGGAWAAGAFEKDAKKTVTAAEATASESPSAEASEEPEPAMKIDEKAKYTMTLTTNRGTMKIAMDAAKTPHTVNSFKYLADKGYFNSTKCHRLTTAGILVLQCGDPEGTGSGGPGYTIPDENLTGLGAAGEDGTVTYPAGTVAMANTGQTHTGGSQFFLVYEDSKLPPTYTPFGTLDADGLKAVKAIGAKGVEGGGSDGAPAESVDIEKATVTED